MSVRVPPTGAALAELAGVASEPHPLCAHPAAPPLDAAAAAPDLSDVVSRTS